MAELNQLPGELNISIVAGDDFSFRVTFPFDLTDYILIGQVGDVSMSIGELDLEQGRIILSLTKEQTKELEDSSWSLRVINQSTDAERTMLAGSFTVKKI